MKGPFLDRSLLPATEGDLLGRVARATGLAFSFLALFVTLHRSYSEKFFRTTGQARWIWTAHRMASQKPVVFFATREFDLTPEGQKVVVRIACDPEFSLYLNGVPAGGGKSGDRVLLQSFDVTPLVRKGRNRIVISVRASEGVGGLLLTLEGGTHRRNILVSDEQWKIFTEWRHDLPISDPADLAPATPILLGQPPQGRWNYPEERSETFQPATSQERRRAIVEPTSFRTVIAALPEKKVLSGVSVVTRTQLKATLFDFGPVRGRGRLILSPGETRVVPVRYLNDLAELSVVEATIVPLVIARGEQTVTDSQARSFRYMAVFAPDALAVVLSGE